MTPKMVKKVIINLDSSKASGPNCIAVVVLENCEPELSYTLAELCNKCLKEPCFPDCWKVSSVVPVFKNARESSTAKTYRLVSAVGKGGHTPSPFSRIPSFLEIEDVPTFYRPIKKKKVLRDSFN